MVIQETCVQPGRDKLRGIVNYAHLYGPWHIHLVHGRSGEDKPTIATDWKGYDGIIAGQMMFDLAEILKRTRIPTVLIDPLDDALKPGSPFSKLSYTLDASDSVGEAGADYFLERGYRHFAYVGASLNRNWSILRGQSFMRRVHEAGKIGHLYPISAAGADGPFDEAQLTAWLKELPKPVALLAAMDTRARQVIDLCTEAGILVPQDVAVLGIDNDELLCAGSIPPPLQHTPGYGNLRFYGGADVGPFDAQGNPQARNLPVRRQENRDTRFHPKKRPDYRSSRPTGPRVHPHQRGHRYRRARHRQTPERFAPPCGNAFPQGSWPFAA